jgi:RNA recognition motif-containing protein
LSDYQTTVYVGNLPWSTTEDDLAGLFKDFGPVLDVRVIQDRVTGRASGYGFVELAHREMVAEACAALNGCVYNGRSLLVSPARPRPPRH